MANEDELIKLEGLEFKDPPKRSNPGGKWKPETKKKRAKQRDGYIKKLVAFCEYNHLTVKEMCFVLNIDMSTFYRYKANKCLPTTRGIARLKKAVKTALNMSYQGETIKRDGKIITIRQRECDEKYDSVKIVSEAVRILHKPTLTVVARCNACLTTFKLETGIKPTNLPKCPCGGVLEMFIGAA